MNLALIQGLVTGLGADRLSRRCGPERRPVDLGGMPLTEAAIRNSP
jgi:hypothetical protein